MFAIPKLFVSLHPQTKIIGLWCNGNTTDSGPVIPGSNPGSPTNHQLFNDKNPLKLQFKRVFCFLWYTFKLVRLKKKSLPK